MPDTRGPALMLILCCLLSGCPGLAGARFPWQLAGATAVAAAVPEVRTPDTSYRRSSSRVMVREVLRPTRANLDYAAYIANNILHRADEGPGERVGAVVDRDRLFGGVVQVQTIVASLASTPLSAAERGRPLAFAPLVDYLTQWSDQQARGLEEARAAVREEAWGLPKVPGRSSQQITTLYLHRPRGGPTQLRGAPADSLRRGGGPSRPYQIWVKIELEPSPRLFSQLPDEDGDGYPEIYGALRADLASDAVLRRIEQDYAGRVLSPAELRSWAHELASYWYPTYNTDLVDLGGAAAWPLPSTERDVVATLGGRTVARPTIVMRGKPQGKALYNVLVVPGQAPVGKAPAAGAASQPAGLVERLKGAPVTARTEELRRALRLELRDEGGGSWTAWAERVKPLHAQISLELKRRGKELKALVGRDGFLFYRNSLDYLVGGDLQAQAAGKNPFPAIVGFQRYLARLGVDFLLVPVPTKAEVYPDKLLAPRLLGGKLPRLSPYGRKLLLALGEAGVEVIDLLPAYLAARSEDPRSEELLYQPQDTHWTDRGLRLAAALIARRVKQYPWYPTLEKQAVTLTLKRVRFKQLGDLQSRLAPREQRRYRPATLIGHQVIRDGAPYEDDASSPIVLLGDSFTGVYQLMGCTHAGVSAHIAQQIRYPLDLVMSYGGGPNVRRQLLSRGEPALRRKRLLIWLFAARDLYNYWEDWAAVEAAASQPARAR